MNQSIERNYDNAVLPEQLADKLGFGDVQWLVRGDQLVWLENRSNRGVLVAGDVTGPGVMDLTREHSVRAGVGYGGGDFSCSGGFVYFVSGQELFSQTIGQTSPSLVYSSKGDIASPASSPSGSMLVYLESWEERERLALIAPNEDDPLDVNTSSDFNMQPVWHPSGEYLAWVTWDHPFMPWEQSCLRLASISCKGSGMEFFSLEEDIDSSIFQPSFSPCGRYLAYVSDRNGWANLRIHRFPSLELLAEVTEEAEHSVPAWLQGMRTTAWKPDSSGLYLIRNSRGFASLASYDLKRGSLSLIRGRIELFTSLSQISVSAGGRIALIGSCPSVPPQILITDSSGEVEVKRKSLPGKFPPDPQKNPVALSWKPSIMEPAYPEPGIAGPGEITVSRGMTECHGLFYEAEGIHETGDEESGSSPSPAVVMIHGGPTSCYSSEYDPAVRFYASRGYAVLALNYRGSTGYGRAYRSLLNEKWGVTDVEDVKDAADFLISKGLVDKGRIFLDGGSAGGFTLLLALIRFPGFFRGGICRYGVADLLMLTRDTHRFESHYLDGLVGKLPECEDRYVRRSPLSNVDGLSDPVAVFQGADDKVVPLNQAEAIVKSLEKRKIPYFFKVFAGEGHGWRKKETVKSYYQDVERFLSAYT